MIPMEKWLRLHATRLPQKSTSLTPREEAISKGANSAKHGLNRLRDPTESTSRIVHDRNHHTAFLDTPA